MSDTETTTEDSESSDDPAGLRKALKEQGETNSELRSQNEQLRKDAAFRDAGVPEEGPGKWFRQGYDGDVDAAKIREAALADGIIKTAEAKPDSETGSPAAPTVSAEELLQFERFDVAGGQPEATSTPDGFVDDLRKVGNYDEATQKLRDAGLMNPR